MFEWFFVLLGFYGIVLFGVYYVRGGCYPGVLVPLLCAIVGWFLVVVAIDIGTFILWFVRLICLFWC